MGAYQMNIDEWVYRKGILSVPHSAGGAAQYMYRHGRKQFNLCGEFCVAFCMQDEAHTNNIDEFLDYWQAKELKWYQSLFKEGLARNTGIYDLEKMIDAYEGSIRTFLLNVFPVDLYVFKDLLETYQLILGVQIDYHGYLVGKGIPHWVVLDGILAVDPLRAVCTIYNPFTNNLEPYTWREVMNSTGAGKSGLWLER